MRSCKKAAIFLSAYVLYIATTIERVMIAATRISFSKNIHQSICNKYIVQSQKFKVKTNTVLTSLVFTVCLDSLNPFPLNFFPALPLHQQHLFPLILDYR